MNVLNQYEKKIISDKEFPVQVFVNREEPGRYFAAHWHEHIEMHYIVKGKTCIKCGQKQMYGEEGHLIICDGMNFMRDFVKKVPWKPLLLFLN